MKPKRKPSAAPAGVVYEPAPFCPLAGVLEGNRLSLARQFRQLRRGLLACQVCQAAQGPCSRMQSLRAGIEAEIRRALADLQRSAEGGPGQA
jgi:hypothetical protein